MNTPQGVYAHAVVDADRALSDANRRFADLYNVDPVNALLPALRSQVAVARLNLAGATALFGTTMPSDLIESEEGLIVRAYLFVEPHLVVERLEGGDYEDLDAMLEAEAADRGE